MWQINLLPASLNEAEPFLLSTCHSPGLARSERDKYSSDLSLQRRHNLSWLLMRECILDQENIHSSYYENSGCQPGKVGGSTAVAKYWLADLHFKDFSARCDLLCAFRCLLLHPHLSSFRIISLWFHLNYHSYSTLPDPATLKLRFLLWPFTNSPTPSPRFLVTLKLDKIFRTNFHMFRILLVTCSCKRWKSQLYSTACMYVLCSYLADTDPTTQIAFITGEKRAREQVSLLSGTEQFLKTWI